MPTPNNNKQFSNCLKTCLMYLEDAQTKVPEDETCRNLETLCIQLCSILCGSLDYYNKLLYKNYGSLLSHRSIRHKYLIKILT